jgi:hypothetical protein
MPNIKNHQKMKEPHLCWVEKNSGTDSRSYAARDNVEKRVGRTKSQQALRHVAGLSRDRDVLDACSTVCGEESGCGVGHGMCVIVPVCNAVADSENVFVLITLEECSSLRSMEECRKLDLSNKGLEQRGHWASMSDNRSLLNRSAQSVRSIAYARDTRDTRDIAH